MSNKRLQAKCACVSVGLAQACPNHYFVRMLGYVALKRPNQAETVAYQLTVCNSLLSTYSLNGVCVCVCACMCVV